MVKQVKHCWLGSAVPSSTPTATDTQEIQYLCTITIPVSPNATSR